MTIGIDLSSLQGAHRMRGIGYTLINLINNLSSTDREKHTFVFYTYVGKDVQDPTSLLNLEGVKYEMRPLEPPKKLNKKLPGRLNIFVSAANQIYEISDLYFGDSRVKDLKGVDFFLQTDQSQYLPRGHKNLKTGLIIYDIIPYVLEWEYMWGYKTARRHGFSRKAALRVHVRRGLYAHKLKVNTRRADVLLSISEHTKNDFVSFLGTKEAKIKVTQLGVNLPTDNSAKKAPHRRYVKTSWGYMGREFDFDPETPFILYVGGADRRRRLDDLVAAFNLLRAQGQDFKLILAGDSMQGPLNISTAENQYALQSSSYIDDIIFMGFVDDNARDWLYKKARVFVFPSMYEGFGLPVLEAMSYGTPLISYKNAAVKEVAGDRPTYVDGILELSDAMRTSLHEGTTASKAERSANIAQAKQWQWSKTSEQIIDTILTT